MDRIASPRDLQAELQSIRAFVHASERPDREVVASKLRDLANRVAAATPVDVLPWSRNDHVPIEDPRRDPTGEWVIVPSVLEIVKGLNSVLKRLSGTIQAKPDSDGFVNVYEYGRLVAVIGKHSQKNKVVFIKSPSSESAESNKIISQALDGVLRRFKPWKF